MITTGRAIGQNEDVEEYDSDTEEPSVEHGNGPKTVSELVIQAQGGCKEAMSKLLARYEDHVFSMSLRRTEHYADAQDLTQEVLMQVVAKIDQLRSPAAFGGWISSMTRCMAVDAVTRVKKGVPTDPMNINAVDRETPVDRLMEEERDKEVHTAFWRLTDLDRETLTAFYLQGQSLQEMSDTFDAPVGTIKRRLHVARKRMGKETDAN